MNRKLLRFALMMGIILALASFAAQAESVIPATSVAISKTSLTMHPHTSVALTHSVKPANTSESITWTSSNPAAVTVNERGVVTAVANGTSVVTASIPNGKSDKITIVVRTIAVKSVSLSKTAITVNPGKTAQLTAKINPSTATYKGLSWSSSDLSVASVDQNGLISAHKLGSAVITVATQDGKVKSCRVSVMNIAVKSIKLSRTSASLGINQTFQLKTTLNPSNAADPGIVWTSSNSAVATVDAAGNVTTLSEGKAVIRATTTIGAIKSANCTVTVKAIRVSSIKINESVIMLKQGDAVTPSVTILPSNATYKNITWTSNNPAVASFDANGTLIAGTGGQAVITGTVDGGRKKATATVRVRGNDYVTINLTAVGDVVLGGDPRSGSNQNFMNYVEQNGGYTSVFQNVRPYLEGDDLTIANLECVLTSSQVYGDKKYVLRGKSENVNMLKDGSINFVALGNNHTKDCGSAGYSDTIKALKSGGIGYAPHNGTSIMNIKGVNIGFTSYVVNAGTNKLKASIATLRKNCDLVVVNVHWGGVPEWQYGATAKQISYAHTAIDAGADLVLGTHTHLVGGIEKYKGKYIVYDLGNFVTCILNPSDKDTFIFKQSIRVYGGGFVEDGGIQVIPCMSTSDPAVNNCQPTPVTGAHAQAVLDKMRGLSAGFATPASF